MCVQMGTMVQLNEAGLFKSQGLIGDKWVDAENGHTLPVCASLLSHRLHRLYSFHMSSEAFMVGALKLSFAECYAFRSGVSVSVAIPSNN